MRKLEAFIFALGSAERSRIRPLQFRGQKRTIFFQILRTKTKGDLETLRRKQQASVHSDRISTLCSEILQACYRDVVPSGGIDLLIFLGNKQLFGHLLHEMNAQESALRSDRDALIAATALVHGMTVVTRNTADFEATGVSVLNPWL